MAGETLALIIGIAVVAIALVAGLLTTGRRRPPSVQGRSTDVISPSKAAPPAADTAVAEVPAATVEAPPAPALERPESTASRLVRLRQRLASSQGALGRGLLGLLSRDKLDEDTWESIEDVLLTADLGVAPTQQVVTNLRTRLRVEGGAKSGERPDVRAVLREELIALVDPGLDRRLAVTGDGNPGVLLVVGVNGAGKTTTVGKIARILVAEDRSVVLGAADTFRAAAVDQLATWGERVGVEVVRGGEGTDPASVAFDAVKSAVDRGIDTVIVDTAGRLQNKAGLMDELGKVKRVIEKQAPVTEVLLVLDATTGQNGLVQAKVFSEVVDVTGVVLTKLDGSAKGGIVVAVQQQLGVPVKLVGLGEGPDDLAPFDAAAFVDALLG
ncbi:signal recognition particle-docking protein FtsY [Nocardioides bigeumensis]|uniref:Signal recognition particle receptor FtsY n=1 Tax=Nocardioides bigeumensis TaxID=433657 RepID=A0ABN2XS51_9ACTN